jgi:hypothetical protein
VIEAALPHLIRNAPRPVEAVVLVGGEAPDERWNVRMRRAIKPVPLRWVIDPVFGYFSEWTSDPASLASWIQPAVEQLFVTEGSDCLVWAHNLGIGRNLHLSDALSRICAARGIRLLAHHHDWWFDNRWQRWPEMRRSGFRTLSTVARTLFPAIAEIRHLAINRADAQLLRRETGRGTFWLPNLTEPGPKPKPARLRAVRAWVETSLGIPAAPFWIVPCRLLRRKNLAEALLLTRWLRPEAWLLTTGGPSSADEHAYAARLAAAAKRHGWRLSLGVLA